MLNLRDKIGQMLVVGFNGSESTGLPVFDWLKHENIGGVILFDYCFETKTHDKNIKNPAQVKSLIEKLKLVNASQPHKIIHPLLVAVDFEGGAVDRFTEMPATINTISPYAWRQWSTTQIINEATKMAKFLRKMGFNLNFAPVVDLALNQQEGIIGKLNRSFSDNPVEVSRLAMLWVDAFKKQGVYSCYKHFPGHGSAKGDTHLGFVDVTDTFDRAELYPYSALSPLQSQSLMVMTAHVINRQLDASGVPATLSYPILTNLLRHQFKFKGIVISDDIQMKALSAHYSLEEMLMLTINAGSDMIIVGNQLDYMEAPMVIDTIEKLVLNKSISPLRIDDAYRRICQFKRT